MDMKNKELQRDFLTLSLANGLGPSTCKQLLTRFENPRNIIEANTAELTCYGLNSSTIKSIHSPRIELIEETLVWLDKPNHHLITIFDDDYPELLKNIHSAPVILFAIGQRQVLNTIPFAIVGSRNPTSGGKKLSESFANELAKSGLTICSGLALGIDYHSHLGALKANAPTIAVLGNGLNSIYPARHKKVASEIIEKGLLVSEFFPETKPVPGNFPRRNRIISGLSVGVLVVEAAKKSGSLITAHYALEQGREVFAIPGSIHNPLARGTHSLIKQGAKLVETIPDIIDELLPLVDLVLTNINEKSKTIEDTYDIDETSKILLESMGFEEFTIDYLIESTGLTTEVVSSMLSVLELKGLIESRHGGKYNRCS